MTAALARTAITFLAPTSAPALMVTEKLGPNVWVSLEWLSKFLLCDLGLALGLMPSLTPVLCCYTPVTRHRRLNVGDSTQLPDKGRGGCGC